MRLKKRVVSSRPRYQIGGNLRETDRYGRFIAYANGTVLDTRTNLMWASKDYGYDINWKDANRFCEDYRGGGYTDWRMPTRDELVRLFSGLLRHVGPRPPSSVSASATVPGVPSRIPATAGLCRCVLAIEHLIL